MRIRGIQAALPELLDASSDLNYGNVESVSNRHYRGPGWVGMPALDARQVRNRDPGLLGDGFLRHSRLAPQLPNCGTERRLRIV
jgi:hypothetical protein